MDCREFLQLAMVLFEKFQTFLLSTSNPERCTDQDIIQTCCLYRDLLITLDTLASKVRLKQWEPQECNYQTAEKALANIECGKWLTSFTPKIDCLLRQKPELFAAARSQKLKMERDDIWNKTLKLVDQKPHTQLISSYDQRKA